MRAYLFVVFAILGSFSAYGSAQAIQKEAELTIHKLVIALDSYQWGNDERKSFRGMQDATQLYKELASLGKTHPDIVIPAISTRLFSESSYARSYLMEALIEMGEASAPAYPWVKELQSVDVEFVPSLQYQRWLQMSFAKPLTIPLEVKIAALVFSTRNRFGLRTFKKEMELVELGKENGPELEKLLNPLLRSGNLEVSKSARSILSRIKKN